MKKQLYDYLRNLGFVKSTMFLYFAFTKGGQRQCIAIPKGRLNIGDKLHIKASLVKWGYITETDFDNQFMYVKPNKRIFMRQLILKRIAEFKKNNENFSKQMMRWQNFEFTWGDGTKTHISKVDFESLDDAELLRIFELIMRKLSKLM
jgi:hypothetical protein